MNEKEAREIILNVLKSWVDNISYKKLNQIIRNILFRTSNISNRNLFTVHGLNKRVDQVFAISGITSFNKVVSLSVVSSFW